MDPSGSSRGDLQDRPARYLLTGILLSKVMHGVEDIAVAGDRHGLRLEGPQMFFLAVEENHWA